MAKLSKALKAAKRESEMLLILPPIRNPGGSCGGNRQRPDRQLRSVHRFCAWQFRGTPAKFQGDHSPRSSHLEEEDDNGMNSPAISRARAFVREINSTAIPAPIQAYLHKVNGNAKCDNTLKPGEGGYSFESKGVFFIRVNGNDRTERQNQTICHEIAHKVLGLPTEHESGPWWSYAKRSPNEIACDTFAAELLLPYHVFKPLAELTEFGFEALGRLADRFEASLNATGSRFATVLDAPCACVLAEQGTIRYAARSKSLREAGGWISPRLPLPAYHLLRSFAWARTIPDRSKLPPTDGSRTGPVVARFWRTQSISETGIRPCRSSGLKMKKSPRRSVRHGKRRRRWAFGRLTAFCHGRKKSAPTLTVHGITRRSAVALLACMKFLVATARVSWGFLL